MKKLFYLFAILLPFHLKAQDIVSITDSLKVQDTLDIMNSADTTKVIEALALTQKFLQDPEYNRTVKEIIPAISKVSFCSCEYNQKENFVASKQKIPKENDFYVCFQKNVPLPPHYSVPYSKYKMGLTIRFIKLNSAYVIASDLIHSWADLLSPIASEEVQPVSVETLPMDSSAFEKSRTEMEFVAYGWQMCFVNFTYKINKGGIIPDAEKPFYNFVYNQLLKYQNDYVTFSTKPPSVK